MLFFEQLIVTVDGQLLGKFTAICASNMNFTPTATTLTVMGPIRMGAAVDEAFLGARLVSHAFTTSVSYSTEPSPSAVRAKKTNKQNTESEQTNFEVKSGKVY